MYNVHATDTSRDVALLAVDPHILSAEDTHHPSYITTELLFVVIEKISRVQFHTHVICTAEIYIGSKRIHIYIYHLLYIYYILHVAASAG